MDVLLINPINIQSRNFGVTPPLNLALIGCELEKHGFSVKILDLEIKPEDFDLYSYIESLSPRIVGISGTSHSRFESFRIAKIAKEVSREIFTIYGGCHATFTSEDTLSHIEYIDYIVRGEGEVTLIELVNFLIMRKGRVEDIAGVSFRRGGLIVQNVPRQRITDLDSLSYSRHLLENEKYDIKLDGLDVPAATIMTARGCPYNCSFCSAGAMFGKTYTMRSPKKVIEEIMYCMEKFNVRGVRFFDSTLTLNKEHLLSLASELKTIKPRLPWHCEIRIDTIDKPLLEAMREAGCYSVDFGIESASENVLRKIGKRFNYRQVEKVSQWCQGLGIRTVAFFSFGHIGETWKDAKETVAFIDKHFNDITISSAIFGIRIYPGTLVEEYAEENGLLPKDFSWSSPFKNIEGGPISTDSVPILLQPEFGIKELRKCFYAVERISYKELMHINIIIRKWREIKSPSIFLQKTSTMFKAIKKVIFGTK